MSWDVEIWHDTTMWNEGFDMAREPYVTVRVPDEKGADVVVQAIAHWNKSFTGQQDPGWDRRFEARPNPSNPKRQIQTLPTVQAVGYVQGAIAMWEGI